MVTYFLKFVLIASLVVSDDIPLSMEEKARRELQKQQRPKRKPGCPPKYT